MARKPSNGKSASQVRREKIIRGGAIVIVLALLLSLLAGAFSVSPGQAAEPSYSLKSVQNHGFPLLAARNGIDTDADGIPNNEDPDIDGDGIVNAKDDDIDGDGVSNFDDGDPAETNGYDGKTPRQPGGFTLEEWTENETSTWVALALVTVVVTAIGFGRKIQQIRGKKRRKNL